MFVLTFKDILEDKISADIRYKTFILIHNEHNYYIGIPISNLI